MKHTGAALLCMLLLYACKEEQNPVIKIEGQAQGTTYHISYVDDRQENYQPQVDSILLQIDSSLSTYLDASLISRINRNDTNVIIDPYFTEMFERSMEISRQTDGIFDVTVGPLVNAYGFGKHKKIHIDSAVVDSLKKMTGYQTVQIKDHHLIKSNPGTSIDFNAIAQGYSVDILCAFLDSKQISNYLVELGGELRAKGNKNGLPWKVGIDQPNEEQSSEQALEAIVELHDKALCTSGNYRKYYEEDGKKYAHIIDPRTGYPAKQNILSSTVVANDATTADAYATAFMIMGLEASKSFLENHPALELEVFFVYESGGKWQTYTSKGLEKFVTATR